jgi:predicted NBD/HSP70 family sugar kinase
MKEYAIGIDVGRTNTKYGIVNHKGDILKHGELKTTDYADVDSFIEGLYKALIPLIDSVGKNNGTRFVLNVSVNFLISKLILVNGPCFYKGLRFAAGRSVGYLGKYSKVIKNE